MVLFAALATSCASRGAGRVDAVDATRSTATTAAPIAATTAVAVATSTTLARTPEGVAATLERYREDDVTNVVQIQIINGSDRTIEVTSLQLLWPAMREQPPVTTPHVLSAGQIVDLPVPAGEWICSDPPRLDEHLPAVRAFAAATVSFDGGPPATVMIPITDTRHVLDRVYIPACQVQRVAYNATVAFDPTWTDIDLDGKPAVAGLLRMTRRHGTEAVVIDEIGRSVLLQFRPATPTNGPLLTLAADQQQASVPVVLTESGECRPHALADSKHTFLLPASLHLDTTPVVIYIIPDTASQPQILTMITTSCRLAS